MSSGRALAGANNSPRTSNDPYIDVEKFIERLNDKKDNISMQLDTIKRINARYSQTISKSIEEAHSILIDNEENQPH